VIGVPANPLRAEQTALACAREHARLNYYYYLVLAELWVKEKQKKVWGRV
jgi:hypothetical protein